MKNIHLLPTEKPSRLLKTMPKGNLILSKSITSGSHWENQNIYITSDEQIKEGDWYIGDFKEIKKASGFTIPYIQNVNTFKKIILTTDSQLIADGVQPIDDEFLEWFVKNPSCEWVEVDKQKEILGEVAGTTYIDFNYKIVIPKEEPKQETKSI